MNRLIDSDSRGQGRDLLKLAHRLADRITWLRLIALVVMLIHFGNAIAPLNAVDAPPGNYVAVGIVIMIGCWTVSGWLLDLGREFSLAHSRSGEAAGLDQHQRS